MKKLLFCLAALPIVSSSVVATSTTVYEDDDPENRIILEVKD